MTREFVPMSIHQTVEYHRIDLLWAVLTKPFPVIVILTAAGVCVAVAVAERRTR